MCATCRTQSAAARPSRWGNRRQRAAGPIRRRWARCWGRALARPPAAVNPLPRVGFPGRTPRCRLAVPSQAGLPQVPQPPRRPGSLSPRHGRSVLSSYLRACTALTHARDPRANPQTHLGSPPWEPQTPGPLSLLDWESYPQSTPRLCHPMPVGTRAELCVLGELA